MYSKVKVLVSPTGIDNYRTSKLLALVSRVKSELIVSVLVISITTGQALRFFMMLKLCSTDVT